MPRELTIKVYSKDNGTVDIQTMVVQGEGGESLTKFFCIDDKVFKYEVYDEFGLLDTVDLSSVSPGSGATSSVGTSTTTTWETLEACCSDWLLTENTEFIISSAADVPILLS